jgi:hypothetical protein
MARLMILDGTDAYERFKRGKRLTASQKRKLPKRFKAHMGKITKKMIAKCKRSKIPKGSHRSSFHRCMSKALRARR